MPVRVIVRAIIAAAIGVENEVPSHSAQPSKLTDGSFLGSATGPWATFVVSCANVDCRLLPRATRSTHAPWLL